MAGEAERHRIEAARNLQLAQLADAQAAEDARQAIEGATNERRALAIEGQGGAPQPAPQVDLGSIIPTQPQLDPANAENALRKSNDFIDQAFLDSLAGAGAGGPQTIQQGKALGGGLGVQQLGGQQGPGGPFQAPPTTTTQQQTVGTEFVREPFGLLGVPRPTTQTTTRPNVLSAAQAAQLNMQQRAVEDAERQQAAAIGADFFARTGNAASAGDVTAYTEAFLQGDTTKMTDILGRNPDLAKQKTDLDLEVANANLDRARAETRKLNLGNRALASLVNQQRSTATRSQLYGRGGGAISQRGLPGKMFPGLPGGNPAGRGGGERTAFLSRDQLLTQMGKVADDFDSKKDAAALNELQAQWLDSAEQLLIVKEPTRFARFAKGEEASFDLVPVVPLENNMFTMFSPTSTQAEKEDALQFLLDSGLYTIDAEGKFSFEEAPDNAHWLLNGIIKKAQDDTDFHQRSGIRPSAPQTPTEATAQQTTEPAPPPVEQPPAERDPSTLTDVELRAVIGDPRATEAQRKAAAMVISERRRAAPAATGERAIQSLQSIFGGPFGARR